VRKVKVSVLIAVAVVIAVALACVGAYFLTAPTPVQPKRLSIGTAKVGAVFYVVGAGIADLVNRYVPGVEMTAVSTGGSTDNVNLMRKGDLDMALIAGDTVYMAYYGKGVWSGSPYTKLRLLAIGWPASIGFMTLKNKGITTMKDLEGKKVHVGAPGSGIAVQAQQLLEAYGLWKSITPVYATYEEGYGMLKAGQVDAVVVPGPPPASAVLQFCATPGVDPYIIPCDDWVIDKLNEAFGGVKVWMPSYIEPGTYEKINYRVMHPAVPALLCVPEDFPSDLAYKILSAIFTHKNELEKVHPAAKYLTIDPSYAPIPWHPAALKYYEDVLKKK